LVLKLLIQQDAGFEAKYRVESEARCLRCNRRLTHPESLVTGIGPECSGRGRNRPVREAAEGPRTTPTQRYRLERAEEATQFAPGVYD
jgi:hypothetical protein